MKRKREAVEYVDQQVQTQTLTEGGTKLLETTNKKNIVLSVHEVKRCKFSKNSKKDYIEKSIQIFLNTEYNYLYDILLTDGEYAVTLFNFLISKDCLLAVT
jgi:hypothetical protein